jgi:altronate hydrolase
MELIQIHQSDNVAVAIRSIRKGETFTIGAATVTAQEDVEKGHKMAIVDICKGATVVKYGQPIGTATSDIKSGQWVHSQNIQTILGDLLTYEYCPVEPVGTDCQGSERTFLGYRRPDGRVGIRNEIWVIPTVGCVNRNAQLIARHAAEQFGGIDNIEGIFEFTHPYGCSQLGEDHAATQRILADLVNHPNAGAVLVLGLGCENNHVEEFKKALGDYDPKRVKFLVCQDVADEVVEGVALIKELISYVAQFQREACPISELVVGLKCGGSDGFSGITANPLVGVFSDKLAACGGSTLLTEVPEMFGAETLLMNRAVDRDVFAKTVKMINDFKQYYMSYNQPVYENPSPGNKKGGITTLEEKSLGCTQKGGFSPVIDVLDYGETVKKQGLNLLNGPGNDMVAATVLAAAGCQLILFTTGRGTPLGTVVPTIKIATNSELYERKANWMDFDAGRLLAGTTMADLTTDLLNFVGEVASGKPTKSETMGFREIAIFKNGVTL